MCLHLYGLTSLWAYIYMGLHLYVLTSIWAYIYMGLHLYGLTSIMGLHLLWAYMHLYGLTSIWAYISMGLHLYGLTSIWAWNILTAKGLRWLSRLSDVLPPLRSWVRPCIEHLIARGKSSSKLCRKSWVFSGFLPQGKLTGWVRINS